METFYVKIDNKYLCIIIEEKEKPIKWSVIEMKIIGISLLMMGCLMGFSLGIDILQGFDVSQALYNALSPFRVMEVAELFVLFFLLFLFLLKLRIFLQRRGIKASNCILINRFLKKGNGNNIGVVQAIRFNWFFY